MEPIENADEGDGNDKARDLLRSDRLTRRERLGERLLRRVGGRMWERPNLAVSARLYKRFQIDDPWAPAGSDKRRKKLGLGPVNLRFGERKRQPAPHLRIKDPNKKKQAQAVDPVAKYRRPKPKPQAQAAPRPTPKPPPKAAPAASNPNAPSSMQPGGKYALPTGSSGEFGGGSQKRGLVGKLPQRPDIAGGKTPPKRSSSQRSAPQRSAPQRSAPQRSAPQHSAPQRSAPQRSAPQRSAPQRSAPQRSTAPSQSSQPKSSSRPQAGEPSARSGGGGAALPRPKLPTPKKRRAGRFRMSPTEARSPVVREIKKTPASAVAQCEGPMDGAPAKKKKVEKPIDRSIPTGPMGLNDLFGAMDGGRMRFGRKRKKKDGEEDE